MKNSQRAQAAFYVAAGLAVLILAAVPLFVCCDDDDDDGAIVTAVYTCEVIDAVNYYSEYFLFYSDATFTFTYTDLDYPDSGVSYTVCAGTYSGDAASDGDLTLTIEKVTEWFVNEESRSKSLVSWIEDYGSNIVEITVSSGEFTISDEYFGGYFSGDVFTRGS